MMHPRTIKNMLDQQSIVIFVTLYFVHWMWQSPVYFNGLIDFRTRLS